MIAGPAGIWGQIPAIQLVAAAYHAVFLALLVAATFIDYDLTIIPDEITVTGMVVGIGLGTLWPQVRPAPAAAIDPLAGLLGRASRACWSARPDPGRPPRSSGVRAFARGDGIRRRHADGDDRRLPGLAGGGPDFLPGPFLGLGHAAWKLVRYLKKWLSGGQLSSADREIPYGPYLSMAAATLLFRLALDLADRSESLRPLYVIFWWMLGIDVDLPELNRA